MLFFIVLDIKKQLKEGINNILKDLETKCPEDKNKEKYKTYMLGVKDTLANLDTLIKTIEQDYDQPGISNSVIVHMDGYDGIEEYDTLGFLESFEDIEELVTMTRDMLDEQENKEDYGADEDFQKEGQDDWDEDEYNSEID